MGHCAFSAISSTTVSPSSSFVAVTSSSTSTAVSSSSSTTVSSSLTSTAITSTSSSATVSSNTVSSISSFPIVSSASSSIAVSSIFSSTAVSTTSFSKPFTAITLGLSHSNRKLPLPQTSKSTQLFRTLPHQLPSKTQSTPPLHSPHQSASSLPRSLPSALHSTLKHPQPLASEVSPDHISPDIDWSDLEEYLDDEEKSLEILKPDIPSKSPFTSVSHVFTPTHPITTTIPCPTQSMSALPSKPLPRTLFSSTQSTPSLHRPLLSTHTPLQPTSSVSLPLLYIPAVMSRPNVLEHLGKLRVVLLLLRASSLGSSSVRTQASPEGNTPSRILKEGQLLGRGLHVQGGDSNKYTPTCRSWVEESVHLDHWLFTGFSVDLKGILCPFIPYLV